MEKNNTWVLVIAGIILGLVVGYMIKSNNGSGMHVMPNGEIMANEPLDMSHAMDSMMSELHGKTGDDFDKAFLKEMIVHHEGAVMMAELALKSAKHEEIKNLSNEIISAQKKEIADMKEWLKIWYTI